MSLFARVARSAGTVAKRQVRQFSNHKDAPKINFFPAEVGVILAPSYPRDLIVSIFEDCWCLFFCRRRRRRRRRGSRRSRRRLFCVLFCVVATGDTGSFEGF